MLHVPGPHLGFCPNMLLVWIDGVGCRASTGVVSKPSHCLENVLPASVLELRMQEMVSMGMSTKPFVDIQPSDAAISDRAVKKGAGNVASALTLTLFRRLRLRSWRSLWAPRASTVGWT